MGEHRGEARVAQRREQEEARAVTDGRDRGAAWSDGGDLPAACARDSRLEGA